MRYAHIIRQPNPATAFDRDVPPPRKFQPTFSKRANTLALDVRHAILSARPYAILIALLVLSACFSVVKYAVSKRSKGLPHAIEDDLPEQFHRFLTSPSAKPLPPASSTHLKAYINTLTKRRYHNKLKSDGVTLIAACKDRRESLLLSVPSWSEIKQINQLIIVDWGSEDPLHWQSMPALRDMMHTGRLSFVHVEDPGSWVMSRAYNLAASMAVGEYILKVDCDTHLEPTFFEMNALPAAGQFAVIPWGSWKNENERRLHGVWLAHAADFRKLGGYDERIIIYGYENLDLYARFANVLSLKETAVQINSMRHNVLGHVLPHHNETKYLTPHISGRVNGAILKNLPAWHRIFREKSTHYGFSYSSSTAALEAHITHHAEDPLSAKTREQRRKFLRPIFETSLNNDFAVPWDLLETITHEDLAYIADALDTEWETHAIVVLLEGPDVITNFFNLVSVVQIAITYGRPTLVSWNSPRPSDISPHTTTMRELFDIAAVNDELATLAEHTDYAEHFGGNKSNARIIPVGEWKCEESLADCGSKYDPAYSSFFELNTDFRSVYGKSDVLPLATSKHTLIRLHDKTLIGTPEMRKAAFKTIFHSRIVREKLTYFATSSEVGVITSDSLPPSEVALRLQGERHDFVSQGDFKILPIIGPRHAELRALINPASIGQPFCEETKCTIEALAFEMANVLAFCEAKGVYPPIDMTVNQAEWTSRIDVLNMIAADLRAAQGG